MRPLSNRLVDRLRSALTMPELEGTRYTLESELGRGGMGVVYAVVDRQLDRRVAMKVLANTLNQGDIDTLHKEAKVIARLEHPGIIPLYDAGSLGDGRFYYTMRIASGRRLDRFLVETGNRAERFRVFERIAETVGYAHSRGVIHCDLKPQNIMVGEFGEVFVLDWGIARSLAPSGEKQIAGTPRYMAPEQGVAEGVVDTRTDIYALGLILAGIAGAEAPRPLLAIASKAAAADPAMRYQSAAALAADVVRFRDRLPVEAYRENLWERLLRFVGRNWTLVLLLVAYLAARILMYFLHRA